MEELGKILGLGGSILLLLVSCLSVLFRTNGQIETKEGENNISMVIIIASCITIIGVLILSILI